MSYTAYHSVPNQPQLREAVAMAMKYKNDNVLMEPGDYVFDSPIQFGDLPFGRIQIGGRLRGSVRWLFPTVKTEPCVIINADRQSQFHDFTVVGGNKRYATEDEWYFEPSYNKSDYIAPGVTENNFGIAIDYNAKAGSWGTTFDRVFVEQCATAWAVTPSGDSNNGSGIKWFDCGAQYSDILMSIGQSQSRCLYVYRFNAGPSRLAFTGGDHGRRIGPPPIIDGFEGSWIHTIGRFSSRTGQVLNWNNMWAERIKGIVHWMGKGPTAASASIRNSTFDINMETPVNPFVGENNNLPCFCETHAPMTFDNCFVIVYPLGYEVTFTQGEPGLYTFRNMSGFNPKLILG